MLRKSESLGAHTLIGCLLMVALAGWPGKIFAQGITQPTFTAAEVNKVIGSFDPATTGDKVTLFEFQHGSLYVASGSGSGRAACDSWWNLANPRLPVLISSTPARHGKPHNIVVWKTYFNYDPNGADMTVWDWNTRRLVGATTTGNNSMVDAWQPPYAFTGTHNYGTQGARFDGWDASNPASITNTFNRDTSINPGFIMQTSATIGNLLVCVGAGGPGVGTYDISDPTNPILLDSLIDSKQSPYTAGVYGSRIYLCQGLAGVGVYDFSDPTNIQFVKTVPTSGNVRYITFKDGKAYATSGAVTTNLINVFDTHSLAMAAPIPSPANKPVEMVYLLGNMMVLGEGTSAAAQSADPTARIIALQQNPDVSSPAVVYINPVNNSVNVGLKSRIGFSMSHQMDVRSLTPSSFILRPVGTTTTTGLSGTYSVAMGVINFSPDSPLLANTTYEVVLPAGGIKDNIGNSLAATVTPLVFSTGPTISGSSDLSNAKLAHRWKLDGDGTDTPTTPVVAANGTLTNIAFTSGRAGTGAAVFDGIGSFIQTTSFDLGNRFTLSAYFWINAGATGSQTVMANNTNATNSNGFRLFVNTAGSSDGKLFFQTGNSSVNVSATSAAGAVSFGAWNHVAVTVDRNAGTAGLYLNGVDVTTTNPARTDFITSAAVYFGQMKNATNRLSGRLDEIRTYSDVLTPASINAAIIAAGNTAPTINTLTVSAGASLVNTAVTFTLGATDANADVLSYSFDFGDGGGQQPYTTRNSATHTFTTPGRYTVNARVKDASTTVTKSSLQVVYKSLTAARPTASAQIIYEAPRNAVWNVNPDSDTVTRIDASSLTKTYEVAVGTSPRTLALRPGSAEVWVTCEGSDQIYILDSASPTGAVSATLATPRGSRPMGICFSPDGAAAYVTYMGSGQLAKWHPGTRTPTATLSVGPTPRPIAISGDSTRIFVGRFISATAPFDVTSEVGEVREIDVNSFTVTRTFALAHDLTPDSEIAGRGTPNYLLQMAITPDGERLFVPSKKDNVDRGMVRDGLALGDQNSVRSIVSQLDLVNNVEALGARLDIDNHGLSHGVAFSPLGDLAFVAFQGNNDIKVINSSTGAILTTLGVGAELAPQDIVFNSNGSRLFVLNFMTRTVSVLDTSGLVNGTLGVPSQFPPISTVATEKLSPTVLKGKQVFYNSADPRMAREGYMSCASCHLDGESDQRTWDFNDQGEGLRNTPSLRGRSGTAHGNFHWTGNFDEVQDFENQIRNFSGGDGFMTSMTAAQSPLGAPNAGRSPELDALADYVTSLSTFGKSPFKNPDGTLTADGVAGRGIFQQLNCASCHKGNNFTDSALSATAFVLRDVGTYKPTSGKRLGASFTGFDTPTMRGLWASGPYLHDGSAMTLLDVITTQNSSNKHGVTSTLTAIQQSQLVAYLQQVDDQEIVATTIYTNSWAVGSGAAGTANWSSPSIWAGGVLPGSGAGDVINFNAPANNASVVNDFARVTMGRMNFAARPGKNYTIGADTNSYPLIFDNQGNGASLANSPSETSARVTINTPITLADHLVVTNNASTTGLIALAGIISESGGSRTLTVVAAANGGTGDVTLSGLNTYTGTTTVASGKLSLASTAAIASSSVVIAAGATFDTAAKSLFFLPTTQTFTLGIDPTGLGRSARINAAGLNISNAKVSFATNGTLDDPVYVLASYTSKIGAAFAVATPPAGYTIDYAYASGTKIALVQTPSSYASWAAYNAGSEAADLDTDKDGVANGVEYFMNSTPGFTANPPVVASGAVRTVTWVNGGNIRSSDYGSRYVVQTSDDLSMWTDVPIGNVATTSGSVTYTLPAGSNSIFVRLLVAGN